MRFLLLPLFSAFLISGCAPVIESHGNIPTASRLAQLETGTHTRRDVKRILGTPSTIDRFENETWYYVGSTQEYFAFFPPKETERSVIGVSFDKEGKIKRIREYDLADSQKVRISGKTTKTTGHDMTVVRQLLGNIGRFDGSTTADGSEMIKK